MVVSAAHPNYPHLQIYFKQTAFARHIKHVSPCQPEYFGPGKTHPAITVWKNKCKGSHTLGIDRINKNFCTFFRKLLLRNTVLSTHRRQRHHSAGSTVVLHPEHTTLEPFSFSSTESSLAFQTSSIHYPLKHIHTHRKHLEGHLQSWYTPNKQHKPRSFD